MNVLVALSLAFPAVAVLGFVATTIFFRPERRTAMFVLSALCTLITPGFVWLAGVTQLIQAFRALAVDNESGLEPVVDIFSGVQTFTLTGTAATAGALLILSLIGLAMMRGLDPDAPLSFRSGMMLGLFVLSIAGALATGEFGSRFLFEPLAVFATETTVPDSEAPMTHRAAELLNLDEAEIGEVSDRLANRLVAIAVVAFVSMGLIVSAFLLNAALSGSLPLPRSVLAVSLILSALASIATMAQGRRLVTLGREIEVVRMQTMEDSTPARPPAPQPSLISPAETFQQGPQEPIRVGGDIAPPKKTKHVNPVYPREAIDAGVQGIVVIEAIIGPKGRVSQLRILRSVQELDVAAQEAVRQWEYEPTLVKEVAVPIVMTVTVNFTLN